MKSNAEDSVFRRMTYAKSMSLKKSFAATIALFSVTAACCNEGAIAQSPYSTKVAESKVDADDRVYWSRLDFVIPFNVDSTGQAPREIQLEFSEDQGRTWSLYQRSDVRTKQFQFQAVQDGEYQFRLKTVDAQGRSFENPGDPLRVVVDTTKPEANLSVGVDQQGVMEAGFSLADSTLDTSTIQLTYQTDEMTQPREIPYDIELDREEGTWAGLGRWILPNNARQMAVRLVAKDKAGNSVEAIKFPKLLLSASATNGMKLASGKTRAANSREEGIANQGVAPIGSGVADSSPIVLPQSPTSNQVPLPSQGNGFPQVTVLSGPGAKQNNYDAKFTEQIVGQQQQLIGHLQNLVEQQQVAARQMLATNAVPTASPSLPSAASAAPTQDPPLRAFSTPEGTPARNQLDLPSSRLPVKEMTDEEYDQVFRSKKATLTGKRSESILVQEDPAMPSARGGQANLEIEPRSSGPLPTRNVERVEGVISFRNNIKPLYSSSKTFSLDYSIDNDSDAQVASVELWGTTDEGRNWQMWGKDPDRTSPFDIQVETEGLFGFRMIIVGANGLASNRPRNGDNADAWIMVDTQMPSAKILSALYGKGSEAGSLVIEYHASDSHFGERPITLSYSEAPTGPWTTIASGVRNNGRYAWPADPSLPTAIFLRLEAHDAAGNVAEHRFENRIEVEGLAPRGKIQGFRVAK
jgi:hypothetical protein